MKNKRLMRITADAVRSGLGGGYYELDAYNQQIVRNGISYAITTRTFGDNNHFLLEITESADSASR